MKTKRENNMEIEKFNKLLQNIKDHMDAEQENLKTSQYLIDNNGPYVLDAVSKAQIKILNDLKQNKKVSAENHNLFVESLNVLFNKKLARQYLELTNDANAKLDILNHTGFECSTGDIIDVVDMQKDRKFPFMQIFEKCDNLDEKELIALMVETYGIDNSLKEMQDFAKWMKAQNLDMRIDIQNLAKLVKNCAEFKNETKPKQMKGNKSTLKQDY